MSGFKDTLQADLKAAMLARDTLRADTLKGLKSAILYEEVAKKVRETGLDDAAIEQIVVREAKKRDEAAELFDKGGNHEAAAKERAEKEILAVYLPEQMSESALQEVIETVVTELQPAGIKDMGRVIGAVKAKTGNAADGAMIAKLVKETLQ